MESKKKHGKVHADRESVISLLLLVVLLYCYQIYQFPTALRFILSLNSICKGIKLYLHEVPDIDVAVCIVELAHIFSSKLNVGFCINISTFSWEKWGNRNVKF